MPTGILDGQGELSTTTRRRLQLFRNTENLANATAAKQAITGQTLLDGEVIIARYKETGKEQQGVLAIKGIGGDYVYFDSAALADALQSVQGGTGISASTKENNSQVILLNISGETQEGKIVINDKTSGENVVEITDLTAANVTYDKGTGDSADKVITGATTTSAAIKELDAALDAANKANLSGATVTAENNVATVTLEDSAENPLASFTVGSSDNNLEVAKATGEGITLDIKSVGATATDGTGTENGDTTATDALTQKSYVDNEIAKAIKNGTVNVATGKATGTTTGTAEFTNNGDNDYYVHLTAGDNVYDIKLGADAFVKDSFLDSVEIVDGPVPDTTATKNAKYFKFVWKTEKGAEGEETETTYIETSEILGDLVGGDGIVFDGSNIAIDLADQTGNSLVKLSLDGDTDGEKQLNVNVTTGETTFNEEVEGDAKKWSVAEGKDGLTTATEVVKVANNLQGQIDKLESESLSGSTAISVSPSTIEGETDVTRVKLVLDADTESEADVTIDGKTVKADRVVTGASNALCVTADGLYLSNVWDCGTF